MPFHSFRKGETQENPIPQINSVKRTSPVKEDGIFVLQVAGERRGDMDWRRGRPSGASPAVSRAASPQAGMGERGQDGSVSPGPPGGPPGGPGGRRRSRVQKQHSYDDEIKASGQAAGADAGLGSYRNTQQVLLAQRFLFVSFLFF